jgi:hypothetical protein
MFRRGRGRRRPPRSGQLGKSFCSVIARRANVCSNQAADIVSMRAGANIDQPIQAVTAAPAAAASDTAWTRSRGSHATISMQAMEPTAAGMTTKAIMKGRSRTK